jgi:hypothetical protein
MTQFLIEECGCEGKSEHHQEPFENPETWEVDFSMATKDSIVFRRSIPHGHRESENRTWPDLRVILAKMEESGYHPKVVIMSRDWNCVIQSQTGPADHVETVEEARENIERCYRGVFYQLAANCRFVIVPYPSLANAKYRSWLYGELRLEQLSLSNTPFTNGDDKYYE